MKHLYRIKQTCMIDLCLYEAGQEVMLDESKASKSLTELIEIKKPETVKTQKIVFVYKDKMIKPGNKKIRTKKQK